MAAAVKVDREHKECLLKLEEWRELLLQRKAGTHACSLPLTAIRLKLDALLDERVEQIGSSRLADVWDRPWRPSWPLARMSRGLEDR